MGFHSYNRTFIGSCGCGTCELLWTKFAFILSISPVIYSLVFKTELPRQSSIVKSWMVSFLYSTFCARWTTLFSASTCINCCVSTTTRESGFILLLLTPSCAAETEKPSQRHPNSSTHRQTLCGRFSYKCAHTCYRCLQGVAIRQWENAVKH